MSIEEARKVAMERFGVQLADSVRVERADFGWIARVEEVAAADGRIGHSVLAIGPAGTRARFYPAGPSARVRRAHLAWLENLERFPGDLGGPPSFT